MTPRPVFLNLMQIKFPMPAIVSILHRISGVALFLLLPLLLWMLSRSLASPDTFEALKVNAPLKFFSWVTLSALYYHVVAGVRHIIMDCGIGESLKGGRGGAIIVMALSALGIIFLGIWLW